MARNGKDIDMDINDIADAAADRAASAWWYTRGAFYRTVDWLRWHIAPRTLVRCIECDEIARWYYVPAGNRGRDYCDTCVPRGCDCRFADSDPWASPRGERAARNEPDGLRFFLTCDDGSEVEIEQRRDEQGRLLPCCEFEYCRWGFPRP